MKKIYESFLELAEEFTDGESLSHLLSDHPVDDCGTWQMAIIEFARALDSGGVKPPSEPSFYDHFWESVHESLEPWPNGAASTKPPDVKIGELTQKEALEKYGKNYQVGHKVFVPSFADAEAGIPPTIITNQFFLIVANP